MKKIIYILFLITLIVFPKIIKAETYTISGTDVTITFSDPNWYVFTRDNLIGNEQLTSLGITYEYMNEIMKEGNIYLDAALFHETDPNENIELFIRAIPLTDTVGNLHAYSEEEINSFGDSLLNSGKFNMTSYKIYGNKYKYIEFEYTDLGYHVYQLYTVINGKGYNFSIQKINAITDSEKTLMKEIIDTIEFDINEFYEQPIGSESENTLKNDLIKGAVIGGVVGGLIGIVSSFFKKKKKVVPINQQSIEPTNITNNTSVKDENSNNTSIM